MDLHQMPRKKTGARAGPWKQVPSLAQCREGDIQEAPSIYPDSSLTKRKSLKTLRKQEQGENLPFPHAKFICLMV